MSDEQEFIFGKCFKQDSDGINCAQVLAVLNKTYAGVVASHTIKLGDDNYVAPKYGWFGGEPGAIHLKLEYCDGEKVLPLDELTWVYVHEATHKFANTLDVGDSASGEASLICYLSKISAMKPLGAAKIKYRQDGLQANDTLKNADSYAGFAVMISRLKRGLYKPSAQ